MAFKIGDRDGATLDRLLITKTEFEDEYYNISNTLMVSGTGVKGQLGNGTSSGVSVITSGPGGSWKQIDAGQWSAAGIKSDGTLWTWGDNLYGQLGDGTVVAKSSPVQVGSLTNWKQVSVGWNWTDVTYTTTYDYMLAVKTDGTLWGWGFNGTGRLGLGDNTNRSSPVQIGSLTNWASATAVSAWSAALKTDDTLWTWGYGGCGQLGAGTTFNRSSPVQIATSYWKSIGCGYNHIIAVKTDGTLWAWGLNDIGELGDGTLTWRSSPVQIGSGTNWKSAAAGSWFSAATKVDDTLWVWGQNTYGMHADGTTSVGKSSPVQVGSATDWKSVALEDSTFLAIKNNGTIWGWGFNGYGQLGDGTVASKSSPVQVGSGTYWKKIFCGANTTYFLK
jgi:alpha-tubulin suppressor-like RCC1 family protein